MLLYSQKLLSLDWLYCLPIQKKITFNMQLKMTVANELYAEVKPDSPFSIALVAAMKKYLCAFPIKIDD